MTYLEYIEKSKDKIASYPQGGFTLNDIYPGKVENLKAINNSSFQFCLRNLISVPLTREFVRGSFATDRYMGYVATMLWGGLGMSNWKQLINAMTMNKDEVERKIINLQQLLNQDRIQEAFMSLQVSRDIQSPHTNKFAGVDISYFTKLLFFLYNGKSTTPPIIFDKWGSYIHAGILISKEETKLLNAFYKMGYNKKNKKFYVAIKSNKKTGYRYSVYSDYLQRMSELASQYTNSNPGLMEEFLFGKDMKHKTNKNNENPRFFVFNYVKDYYDNL